MLEEFLERRFGLRVERQVELMTFEQDDREVRSRLRHADGREENVTTPWLAGCDGSHSTVRKLLGMGFEGSTSPTEWILADVGLDQPVWPEDESSAFMDASGVMCFFSAAREAGAS